MTPSFHNPVSQATKTLEIWWKIVYWCTPVEVPH